MKQQTIELSNLELDPKNPRLPENVGGDPEEVLTYIYLHGALDELAYSFVDNGFFEAERLIVLPNASGEGKFTVVEGNRRLATLKILHGELGSIPFTGIDDSNLDLSRFDRIPCIVVDDRVEVDTYLAYRHIGGMKTWSAEARARFTQRMVDDSVNAGNENPFRSVGKQIGSNAQGIRNSYLAIHVLEHARDELGLSTEYLHYERFGVWIRCMNSSDIRSYVGIGKPTTFEEVKTSVAVLDEERLREVVSDLSLQPGSRRPLVADSRDITTYGRILMDEGARSALRQHGDFDVARQIVDRRSIPSRITSSANSISAIMDELNASAADMDPEPLLAPSEKLFGSARSLRAVVRDLVDDAND